MMRAAIASVLLLAAASAGCGSNTATSPSSTSPTVITEIFSGTLAAKGSIFYSFSISQAGVANITLASITSGSQGLPTSTAVGVGVGIPSGEGCGITSTSTLTPSLTAQLTPSLSVGVQCVEIHDLGNLTGPVNFAIRIVHP